MENLRLIEQKNIHLFKYDESEKKENNIDIIIGADEAGRGPAAGGVFAAAVSFFDNVDINLFETLNDSKKLSAKRREVLYDVIRQNAYCAIKYVDVEKIEEINILQASLYAMKCAIEAVCKQMNSNDVLVLIDGNQKIKNVSFKQKNVIKGDATSASIAAASILAKVSRDRYMDELAKKFPNYDWESNKGYLTKKHIQAIQEFGICEHHRKSFLKNIIKSPQETQGQLLLKF